uniref:Homeobox domain-containing protein n=1 Tax=Denticeps clupeoides TaxID=299321 RepID=A0AAY4BSZ4_9TELE
RKNDDSSEFTDSVQFQRKPPPASDKSEAEQAYASSPVTATSGLNQTHMVCLPKVAEKLRLVWKRAEHIQPLDGQTALVDAFNAFPYPTFQETSALALQCSLELEQVRVWFMMQRVRYGISWAEEDIQETRRKLQLLHAEEVEEEQLEEVTENWGIGLEEEDEDEEEEEMMRAFGASETMIRERRQAYAQASFGTFSLSSSQNQPRQPCLKQTPDQPHQSPAQPQPHCPPTQDIHQSVPTMQQGRVRSKKSKAQLMMLRRSFVRNNWPSDNEVQRLQATTGLGRHNIRKWFADSRYQLRRSGARWHDKHDLSSASLRSANSIPRSKDYKWRRTPKHLQGKSFSSSQWPGSSRPGAEIEVELNEEDGMMAMFNRTKEENSEVNVDGTYLSVNGHSTAFSSASSAIPSNSFLEKKKRKKTLEQTEILRRSFLKCQWPSPEQYQRLEQLTGLPRTQIIHWFGDTRYAVKHSRLRWINSDERQHIAAGLKQQQVDGGRQWGGRRQPPEALGSTPPYTNHGPASSISGGAEAGSIKLDCPCQWWFSSQVSMSLVVIAFWFISVCKFTTFAADTISFPLNLSLDETEWLRY